MGGSHIGTTHLGGSRIIGGGSRVVSGGYGTTYGGHTGGYVPSGVYSTNVPVATNYLAGGYAPSASGVYTTTTPLTGGYSTTTGGYTSGYGGGSGYGSSYLVPGTTTYNTYGTSGYGTSSGVMQPTYVY